jgi:thioredoxin 1
MSNLNNINDESFEKEVLQANLPVIVDFWAEWCGPCKMLTPILEEAQTFFANKVTFVKMNVDENTKTPASYNVRGIPTLLLFHQGEIIASKVGLVNISTLKTFINEALEDKSASN